MPSKSEQRYITEDLEMEYADETGELEEKLLTARAQESILRQCDTEWNSAYQNTEAKRSENLARLKLYNNQLREKSAVGEPLLFSVFNTIHAALYDDRLMRKWEGRAGEGDEDVEDNLNALDEHDYDLTRKAITDYFWNWDAEFFGRGLKLLMEFDRSAGFMCPIPEYIDASTFIRDPEACSVNGIGLRGKGAMRFGGYEIGATYWDLKEHPAFFNLKHLRKDAPNQKDSTLEAAREAHALAQNTTYYPNRNVTLGKFDNYEFRLVNWFTHIRGKKHLVTLANNRTLVVRLVNLEKFRGRWPIIDRPFYPMATNWDGVSIPDLCEDKQRAKAVLMNLGLKSAKADVNPRYIYDKTKIKNTAELNRRFEKYIGVAGSIRDVMAPVQSSTIHQYVDAIMSLIDTSAQKAVAAPEMQQGMLSQEKRTLGELELVSSGVNTRYSMTAKVYGWSEQEEAMLWYLLYKLNFKEGIDEKIVRIAGPLAPTWRPLTRENIISEVDPDVRIESKVISEGKSRQEFQKFSTFAAFALQEPTADRRLILKRMARYLGQQKQDIDAILPPTVDEMQAEDENMLLNDEHMPTIAVQDDHQTHIRLHAKANVNAKTLAHIAMHKQLMVIKRNHPELFPAPQAPQFQVPAGATETRSPVKAAPAPTTPTQ